MTKHSRSRRRFSVLETLESRQMLSATVTGWNLVNADTNQVIAPLTEQLKVDLAKLPTRDINIVPTISDTTGVGSVVFKLDANNTYHKDNAAPYSLEGDASAAPLSVWQATVGNHSIGAFVYSGANGGGTSLTHAYVNFSIVDSAPKIVAPSVTGFSVVNADTGAVISPLNDGATIDLNKLPTRNVNVVANVGGSVGSVVYAFDGNGAAHTDDAAPYTLAGDANAAPYAAWAPTVGSHSVTATAASGADGTGTTSAPTVVNFSVIDTSLNPRPVITAQNTSVMTGIAVHVQGLSTTLNSGTALTATYAWDFGDPGSKYNDLEGFNAGHVYDTPGTYTVTLTVTDDQGRVGTTTQTITVAADSRRKVYVSSSTGSDANDGSSPSKAVASIARVNQLDQGDNVEVLFLRGDIFAVPTAVYVPGKNVLVGAYGDASAPQPVLRRSNNTFDLLHTGVNSDGVTFQDLTLDTDTPTNYDKTGAPRGLTPVGRNISIRDCTIANVSDFVTADQNPVGMLVQDNHTTSDTSIRGYLFWVQGSDIVVLGNSASNSTREHIMRVGGADRVLAAYNDFANISRQSLGDMQDYAKGTFTLQKGSYWTIEHNTINGGGLGVGPLGGVDGVSDPGARAQWAVVAYNTVTGGVSIGITAGSQHVNFHDNVIYRDSNEAIIVNPVDLTKDTAGRWAYPDRNVYDVTIAHNTGIDSSNNGKFFTLAAPTAPGQITLVDNLFIAPNLETGYNQNAEIYVSAPDLSSFAKIDGNIFSVPHRITWVANAYVYVAPTWAVASGYLSADQWNALPQVGTDQFANVSLPSGAFAATVNGVTAGANLAG